MLVEVASESSNQSTGALAKSIGSASTRPRWPLGRRRPGTSCQGMGARGLTEATRQGLPIPGPPLSRIRLCVFRAFLVCVPIYREVFQLGVGASMRHVS
jgi:hypothetical protein